MGKKELTEENINQFAEDMGNLFQNILSSSMAGLREGKPISEILEEEMRKGEQWIEEHQDSKEQHEG